MTRIAAATVLTIAALTPALASAQVSAPGPYVIDLRGAMSGAPGDVSFYPPLSAAIRVPQRAFGVGAGAHVYAFRLGVARLGFGIDVTRTRGTTVTDASAVVSPSDAASAAAQTGAFTAAMTVNTISPQLSFNFGTHEGWSYLSGGYGTTATHAEVSGPASVGGSRNRHAATLNFGGGARWFLREHLAVGFDVRFHRLRATGAAPSKQVVGLSVGMSLR